MPHEDEIGELELIGEEISDLLDDDDDDGLDAILEVIDALGDDDDDDDEIGARLGGRRANPTLRRKTRAKKLLKQRLRRRRAAPPARIREREPAPAPPVVYRREVRARTLMLGGQATQNAIAGHLQIATTVQELARVDRLFITGIDENGLPIHPSVYSIADIKVGTKSQLAATDPLPGVMFTSDATGQGVTLGLDTIQTGTSFTVVIADAPANSTFRWGAFAEALR